MCMEDCVKPTLKEMPTYIIFHVGTNDVPPEQIAEKIGNLASNSKRMITLRNDQYQRKAADVNRKLKEKCRREKLQFLDHGNTISVRHLNALKLHLNKRGTLSTKRVQYSLRTEITTKLTRFILYLQLNVFFTGCCSFGARI